MTFIDSSKPDRPEQAPAMHFRDPLRAILYVSAANRFARSATRISSATRRSPATRCKIFSHRHHLPDHALIPA